jgi:hypothetical protein
MRKPRLAMYSHFVKITLGVVLGLAVSSSAGAQSSLENPAPGSFQSGIGLVSGWKCTAGTVTASFDDGPPIEAAYGTGREDTRSVCDDANNGFGLLWNFNLLGDGQHTVRLFDNGAQFAEATFTVSTFGGEEFLRNASRILTTGFGGCRTTLQWQESQQNFAIAATDACFQPLLGQWAFLTQFPAGSEIDHYQLEQIETRRLSGTNVDIEGVAGTDLDHGGEVQLLRVSDIPGVTSPYAFTLASIFSNRCEIFFFDQLGPDTVQGIGTSFPADPVGGCLVIPSPTPSFSSMTGSRTGAAFSEQQRIEGFSQTQPQSQTETAEQPTWTFGAPLVLEKTVPLRQQGQP